MSSFSEQAREVFSPCAAALYRRSEFLEVGGFDEDYFCYVDEVDLGFRLRLAGYRCLHVPTSVAHHVGSGTTGGQYSAFAVYHGHRNLVWIYVKDMPGILFWTFLPQQAFSLETDYLTQAVKSRCFDIFRINGVRLD